MTTAATDIVQLKLERAFGVLDADSDGRLTWSDYEDLVDRYLHAYRLGRGDRRAKALQAFYQIYWLELLRHADVQGDSLTKEQFIAANRLASVDTSRLNMVEGSSQAIFDCMDANGDNEISRDEFAAFLRDVWRITAPDAMDSFEQLDADGDGSISRQEFIRATREYFHSNDPATAGSLVFGHF